MSSACCFATIDERRPSRPIAARHLRLVASRPVRVVISHDLELQRAGLRALLQGEDDIVVVGEARRGHEASTMSRVLRPDVVVLDLGSAEVQVLEAAWQIVTDPDLADVGVLILTSPDPEGDALSSRRGGVCRFLVRDSARTELVAAVRELASRPQRLASGGPNRNPEARSWNSAT